MVCKQPTNKRKDAINIRRLRIAEENLGENKVLVDEEGIKNKWKQSTTSLSIEWRSLWKEFPLEEDTKIPAYRR